MSRIDEKLSNIFDIEIVDENKSLSELKIDAQQAAIDDLEEQKKYAKDNLVELIEKGKTAIDDLQSIAKQSEKSRDFEVLFTGIKTISEVSEKLLNIDLESVKQKSLKNDPQAPQTVNQTAVFVGSTFDLAKLLKDNSQ